MPLYDIEHSIPLDKPQRDALAQAITHIHTHQFTTPSLFVNISITNSDYGFQVGEDGQWLAANSGKFQEWAEQGDEVFRELVEEIKGREDLGR
ncbi:hypothetical protein BO82DRAFT_406520 [Aspergillus uvarum CBS 121591]|uniref:Tautomerase cis-CaaD-like domain-containing protein n=1 Tax=Aspergillus uvarum CBS 121591 TaxID=1448315 RepID=A0A319BZX4_9EURO|nr:hypothetical protein BO82DRAFT_406520 [Aspergillus uvarum CBS 121591]PYH77050.1 hypothetical protein BO82DRAFT_406520 [Aspergillus uvarum CBS 121591]